MNLALVKQDPTAYQQVRCTALNRPEASVVTFVKKTPPKQISIVSPLVVVDIKQPSFNRGYLHGQLVHLESAVES